MKMIIVMFLHCVSDLALLCRLSTKDFLEKVLSDPLQEGFSVSPSKETKARRDHLTPASRMRQLT